MTDFLRKTFPRRGPRWLTRLLRPLPDKAYSVSQIVPFDDGGFFAHSCVFTAFAPAGLLEGNALPTGGSYGLFALSPEGLSYLTRHPEDVEALLRLEARPLEEGDALAFARFFTEALDRKGNDSGNALGSTESLPNYAADHSSSGGGYVLDAAEYDRVRSQVHAPTIVGNRQSGWHLEYCSVFGWMHQKNTLCHHRVDIDGAFRIAKEETVLSPKIFSWTPGVRYCATTRSLEPGGSRRRVPVHSICAHAEIQRLMRTRCAEDPKSHCCPP